MTQNCTDLDGLLEWLRKNGKLIDSDGVADYIYMMPDGVEVNVYSNSKNNYNDVLLSNKHGIKTNVHLGSMRFGRALEYLKKRYETKSNPSDPVKKPSHYHVTVKTVEGAEANIDCLAVTETLGFNNHHYIASAFAYIWRCLRKGRTVEDLEKAVTYLQREIANRKAAINEVK